MNIDMKKYASERLAYNGSLIRGSQCKEYVYNVSKWDTTNSNTEKKRFRL